MHVPYEWQVGWRYTRTSRGGRRNRFISFISGIAILGIALGVAALIVVLSVMNGFHKEVRSRMLAVVPQIEIETAQGAPLADWQGVVQLARDMSRGQVRGGSPYVNAQVLLARGEEMRGVFVRGIEPTSEAQVTPMAAQLQASGLLGTLQPSRRHLLLGSELARQLNVKVGDTVMLLAPTGREAAGQVPQPQPFEVSGLFTAGHHQYDSGMALAHLHDVAEVFGLSGPTGVQLRLADADAARSLGAELAQLLGPAVRVQDWTRTNQTWFESVEIQKRMLGLILMLIVAVAAFNLVSTLVMTVTDKQADIAILRTLGASPRSIQGIFMVQGATAGLIGTVAGVGLGLLIALNVGHIVPAIERVLGMRLLDSSIYLISQMPSDPRASDVVPIALASLLLAFVATLYPSWRASRVQPAQALRENA